VGRGVRTRGWLRGSGERGLRCVRIAFVRRCADLPGGPFATEGWTVEAVVGCSLSQGCALGYFPARRLRLYLRGGFWGDENGAPPELF
jgi:hypothetical protein